MQSSFLRLLIYCLLPVETIAQQTSIAALRENILYVGLPNSISAVAAGYSCRNIIVETNNGRLEKTGECQYTLWTDTSGTATIQIFSRVGRRSLGGSIFRVKNLPSPTAYIGGKKIGRIAANILRVQLGVAMVLDGFDFDIKFNVTQYFLTIIGVDGQCSIFGPAHTAFFTEPMKTALQKVKSGDRLIITGIRVLNYSKDELIVAPIDLTVE